MRRQHRLPALSEDEGFTLIETMVAIVLVTIAVFALTAELGAYLHHQANEKSRTSAVRLMTTTLENARHASWSTVKGINGTNAAAVGRFTTTTQVQQCTVTDPEGTCTAPASDAVRDVRVRVTVSWLDGSTRKQVSSYTSLADDADGSYSPTGSGTLSTLVGGVAQTATTATVSSFTASPSPTSVQTTGVPTSPVTLSMTSLGLTAGTTSIPVTWTDDNGSHQVSLTGGPSSWSATVPAASIKKVVASGTSTITFAATVPGTSALVTAVLTVKPAVGFTSCTVSPTPIPGSLLTRKTTQAETLTCTTYGLASTDTVSVSFTSGSSTATRSLTSSNGTTWTTTLASGTSLATLGLTEAFTFTATRASDGVTATTVVNAGMSLL